ncbi:MAG TPA: rod shape-determining protein MreC [Rickettsiales bacterium]|nr:rod shape-determining protein MreC [Rickettsiales bacterium]
MKIFYFLLIILSVIIISISINNKKIDLFVRDGVLNISRPFFVIAKVPFNLLTDFIFSIKDLALTYIKNEDLKKENITLRKLYLETLEMGTENKELKEMVNFIDEIKIEFNFVTSKVYLSPKNNMVNSFILNVGTRNYIKEGYIVIGKNKSVIGRVINVRKNYCDVLLLTDINSKIPVYTLNTNEKLILSGINDSYLNIDFFNSKKPNLIDGDLVYTSGDSNVIPNGLYVGKIKKIHDRFVVETDENINTISNVMIIIPKLN